MVIATARTTSAVLEQALGLAEVLPWDVMDAEAATLLPDADILFHCATANDIVSRDFKAGVDLSVNGTRNVLEHAVKRGIRQVVFFSTLQVYGTELRGEITEDTPARCESAYGLNHLLGEEVCRWYANTHGLDVVLMRPANVIGVPDSPTVQRSTLVPMCFVKDVLATGRIVLRSSGRQTRNFVSSDLVADMCLHLVKDFPAGATVINAGSQWHASVREMGALVVEACREKTGVDAMLEVQSEEPAAGNEFRLHSRLGFLAPPVETAVESARQMTGRLFDFFRPESINA